jgi:hypothetical protein
MEWVASTLKRPRNVVYPALLTLMRTPRLPAVYRTDSPAELNGLVRLGERRNVVSTRVPSRSARGLYFVRLDTSNTRNVLKAGCFVVFVEWQYISDVSAFQISSRVIFNTIHPRCVFDNRNQAQWIQSNTTIHLLCINSRTYYNPVGHHQVGKNGRLNTQFWTEIGISFSYIYVRVLYVTQ